MLQGCKTDLQTSLHSIPGGRITGGAMSCSDTSHILIPANADIRLVILRILKSFRRRQKTALISQPREVLVNSVCRSESIARRCVFRRAASNDLPAKYCSHHN